LSVGWFDGDARRPLGWVADALKLEAGDLLERNFYSRGRIGALAYTRRKRQANHFADLFARVGLEPGQEAVSWRLLSAIPAETHAVRLLDTGAISLFFKADLASRAAAPLFEALGAGACGEDTLDLFQALGPVAAGLAVEMPRDGAARLRLYYMLDGWARVEEVAGLLRSRAGWDVEPLLADAAAFYKLTGDPEHVVLNIGSAQGGGCSAKLEFAAVSAMAARESIDLHDGEKEAWYAALRACAETGTERFSYVGLRYTEGRNRELTFYVDTRAGQPIV
jgi:hypothetical protein